MKKKLILFNTLIVTVALLLMFGLGILVTKNNNYSQAEEQIVQLTQVYAQNYSGTTSFSHAVNNDIRITIIDATGKVIADSETENVDAFENHITREEIVNALNNKPKTVIRYSSTLNKNMMYYVEKVETGDTYVFVRFAMPVESVNAYVIKTIPLMLCILAAALLLSVIASMFLANGLLKPLQHIKSNLQNVEDGIYKTIIPATDDNSINEIIGEINSISEKLQNTIQSAQDDKQRLDYIIQNVSDGIVAFGQDKNISLINPNAQAIFGITEAVGKTAEALTADSKFNHAINECFETKKSAIFELNIDELIYLCAVKYTDDGMLIAVLSDITAARNNEKMRSEFFANASHELKTPLTSIKGFNEMIALKSKDANIKSYSEKIDRESTRMLSLIDDMLNLSKLENTRVITKSRIDVKEVATEVAESLSSLAKHKNVTVEIRGEGTINAEKEHVFELIKNLTENAIRYNNKGGHVKISIAEDARTTSIGVSDNGIGIDDEHQSRIFERFYRIDKSRSRETGGTGLGLSIVKHIAELYNADLKLTSKLGVGTDITVSFNK